jgi:SAM-dependent methyltransferase
MSVAAPPVPLEVTWHDAECGGYGSDLRFWEALAVGCGGAVLDLGAGTGRVALHLAAAGHEVVAVEVDRELAAALDQRAAERGLDGLVEVVCADVRSLDLDRRFPLILAPMQLMHMFGGPANRRRALDAIAAHLQPGGTFATAVLAEPLSPSGPTEPLPDVREVGGWIHSSLPLEVRVEDESLTIVRMRQLVAPGGELSEDLHELTVDRLPDDVLEEEAAGAGLTVTSAASIPETDDHVGSAVLIMELADA